jgi:BlaI family transcriptional regulator, penicillinase repressor
MSSQQNLSRRERQIMDAIFQTGEATAAEVRERMPDPPTYTAVRTLLRILEDKGLVVHRVDGKRYVYTPRGSSEVEGRSAFRRVLRVFFGGSLEQAVAAHLSDPRIRPDKDELQRMRALIEELDEPPASRSRKPGKGKKS